MSRSFWRHGHNQIQYACQLFLMRALEARSLTLPTLHTLFLMTRKREQDLELRTISTLSLLRVTEALPSRPQHRHRPSLRLAWNVMMESFLGVSPSRLIAIRLTTILCLLEATEGRIPTLIFWSPFVIAMLPMIEMLLRNCRTL